MDGPELRHISWRSVVMAIKETQELSPIRGTAMIRTISSVARWVSTLPGLFIDWVTDSPAAH